MLLLRKEMLVAVFILCAGNAFAAEDTYWPEEFRLAGEIIISPRPSGATSKSGSGASDNRDKARSYQQGTAQTPSIIIISEDDESGLFLREGGTPQDNRSKAREYLRDPETGRPTTIMIIPDQKIDGKDTNQNSLDRNRSKARRYSDGDTAGAEGVGKNTGRAASYLRDQVSSGVVGPDGVLVVVCTGADNAAGYIGELTSGSVFTLMINGKAVKARCK